MTEQAFTFDCQGDALLGFLHLPDNPSPIGLLILVGGPQYRVGAHRQYLHLARTAAASGIAAMRFDYRGVGDSEGTYPGFEHLGADIDAAIDTFKARLPHLRGVVLWGMCEGASAILIDGVRNPFVRGAALVNPWVRTASAEAQTYLKHYYGKRILSPNMWKRVLKGEVNLLRSVASVFGLVKQSRAKATATDNRPYPDRMAAGLRAYQGRCLLLMSEHDLVAREFEDVTASAPLWSGLIKAPKVVRIDVNGSDHTFSSEPHRQAAADATLNFVRDLAASEV
ncbi:hydrolase 1, exosortase A system-associated [Govanella unica]|uniref:Hydrolase 1, exosortase A system-associated n=1 Tax=Govanella unica TaxID=2975056 RepID=A0A9X3Z6Y5_9PROT|nr:hydrolase 1, exosortase A system-associated [Govania unica]MDA5193592.1 hydrolase 1, exosortase A system-associated [Govania unica]